MLFRSRQAEWQALTVFAGSVVQRRPAKLRKNYRLRAPVNNQDSAAAKTSADLRVRAGAAATMHGTGCNVGDRALGLSSAIAYPTLGSVVRLDSLDRHDERELCRP